MSFKYIHTDFSLSFITHYSYYLSLLFTIHHSKFSLRNAFGRYWIFIITCSRKLQHKPPEPQPFLPGPCPAFAYYGGQAGFPNAGRSFPAEYNSALLNWFLVKNSLRKSNVRYSSILIGSKPYGPTLKHNNFIQQFNKFIACCLPAFPASRKSEIKYSKSEILTNVLTY